MESKNRYLIAIAAVLIHVSIGSVYAWSVFTNPVMKYMNVSLNETQWVFSLAIFFLGMSAAFLGKYVEKYGPRKSGIVSSLFFTIGLFGSGLAVYFNNIILLYLFYSIIGGIGLGIGYITPVSTLVKWFPNKRGLATGLAIMGFGFGALFASPIIQYLISEVGLMFCFITLGILYLIIMLSSSLYLEPPKTVNDIDNQQIIIENVSLNDAMKTWQFYMLWIFLYVNIACGISLLSIASPMIQETLNVSAMNAAVIVGVIGIINGLGRLCWAAASDYLGRFNTYLIFFAVECISFYLLSITVNYFLFIALILIIISCYGGGFAAMPAFLSDFYGTKSLGAIHGRVLSAWAIAGITGPILTSFIRETTGSYIIMMLVFSIVFALIYFISFAIDHLLKIGKIKFN